MVSLPSPTFGKLKCADLAWQYRMPVHQKTQFTELSVVPGTIIYHKIPQRLLTKHIQNISHLFTPISKPRGSPLDPDISEIWAESQNVFPTIPCLLSPRLLLRNASEGKGSVEGTLISSYNASWGGGGEERERRQRIQRKRHLRSGHGIFPLRPVWLWSSAGRYQRGPGVCVCSRGGEIKTAAHPTGPYAAVWLQWIWVCSRSASPSLHRQ